MFLAFSLPPFLSLSLPPSPRRKAAFVPGVFGGVCHTLHGGIDKLEGS